VRVHKGLFFSGKQRGAERVAEQPACCSRFGGGHEQENRVASNPGQADVIYCCRLGRKRDLCQFEAREQDQVVSHHGGPDVGLDMVEAAPGAACGAIGALEAGDAGLDAGAEVAQPAVHPRAFDHVGNGDATLLVERDIGDAAGLGGGEIGAAGVAAIGGGLPRRRAGAGDVAIEHRQKALGIGRIASLDNDIEDQAAFAGSQIELVAVLDLAPVSDDDVSVRLEQTDQLLACLHASPLSTRRSAWTMMRVISGR